MAAVRPRTISINCNVLLIPGKAGVPEPSCTACREMLELHQPDVNRPDRFLATCAHCGSWHLLEQPEEDGRSLLARLPEFPEFMQANNQPLMQQPRARTV